MGRPDHPKDIGVRIALSGCANLRQFHIGAVGRHVGPKGYQLRAIRRNLSTSAMNSQAVTMRRIATFLQVMGGREAAT